MSETSSPSNARRPVSISYSTTPNAQTSARRSTALPRACSGAMYAAVPRISPISVPCAVSVGEFDGDPRAPLAAAGIDGLRQAEVQDLDRAVAADFDVGRLQVAVDDALLVRGFERVGDLPGDRERLRHRQGAARDERGEVVALNQLHDERRRAGSGRRALDAVDLRDVGMVECGERLRLAREPRYALAIAGHGLGKRLDGDVPVQLRIARAIHLTHAAFAQLGDDFVGSNLLSNHAGRIMA